MKMVGLGLAFCAAMIGVGMTAQAVPIGTVVLTVDERGDGVVDYGFGNVAFRGVLAPDPGPGGLQSALTFGFVGLSFPHEPPLEAGDVLIRNASNDALLDILRFNPAGTGGMTGYIPSMVLYSIDSQGTELADTPVPPSSFYDNTLTLFESGTEGPITLTYEPEPGQPGFVPGFTVTYGLVPQVPQVPEPTGIAIFGIALAALATIRLRAHRKSATSPVVFGRASADELPPRDSCVAKASLRPPA